MLGGLIVLPIGSLPRVSTVMNPLVAWTGDPRVPRHGRPGGVGQRRQDVRLGAGVLPAGDRGRRHAGVVDPRSATHALRPRVSLVSRVPALRARLHDDRLRLREGVSAADAARRRSPGCSSRTATSRRWACSGPRSARRFRTSDSWASWKWSAACCCSCPARNWPARWSCFGATFEVFMLNMTYDVPVKLFSFHLVVMSVVLIAPYAKPLGALVFRPGARSLVGRDRADDVRRLSASAWPSTAAGRAGRRFGPGAPKPPLYGIWTIEQDDHRRRRTSAAGHRLRTLAAA